MMHGYLEAFLPQHSIYSAGVETHGLNKKAVAIMQKDGLDISSNSSNHIDEYTDIEFDHIITVCDHAKESCPVFPKKAAQHHYSFEDPSKLEATETEITQEFTRIRNQIKAFAKGFSCGIA